MCKNEKGGRRWGGGDGSTVESVGDDPSDQIRTPSAPAYLDCDTSDGGVSPRGTQCQPDGALFTALLWVEVAVYSRLGVRLLRG